MGHDMICRITDGKAANMFEEATATLTCIETDGSAVTVGPSIEHEAGDGIVTGMVIVIFGYLIGVVVGAHFKSFVRIVRNIRINGFMRSRDDD